MLSKMWTVDGVFEHVMGLLKMNDQVAYAQKYEILNNLQSVVVSELYSLLYLSYMTPEILLLLPGAGKWQVTANGIYLPSSSRTGSLSVPSINTSFVAGDAGNVVVFRGAAATYIGTIASVTNGTNIQVVGSNLPAVLTNPIHEVMVIGDVTKDPGGSETSVSIAGINMMRVGHQVHMILESSATKTVNPVGLDEFRQFDSTSTFNRKTIIWCLSGETLLLKSSLSSYGTLTLRYPRIPTQVVSGTDYLDVPDGPVMSLLMVMLKARIANVPTNPADEMKEVISSVYRSYGVTLKSAELDYKVKALS